MDGVIERLMKEHPAARRVYAAGSLYFFRKKDAEKHCRQCGIDPGTIKKTERNELQTEHNIGTETPDLP